jgi:TetR/AcrR family transcriptional regulator, transcriptional repressor for nem operon
MRYAPDHKEKTRARILGAAGRVFRRHGYHAAGVDKVMEEAGLTAGGFYAHFESKQALLAEAVTCAAAEAIGRSEEGLEGLSGGEWIDAFLGRYLSMEHRRVIEDGCPVVALISEVSRADETVKQSFEAIVRALESKLASHASGGDTAHAEERALAALSLCVGGLGLARAVCDEGLAERILDSCRKQAKEMLSTAKPYPGSSRPTRKGKSL